MTAVAKKAAACKKCAGTPLRTCDVADGAGVCGRPICPHLSKRTVTDGKPFDTCGPCNMRLARERKKAGGK